MHACYGPRRSDLIDPPRANQMTSSSIAGIHPGHAFRGALLGLLVAFNIGHLTTLKRCESALLALTLESKALTSFDPASLFDDLRDEVGEMVSELVAQMRVPTVADHLGGVMAQFAQMRMMKMMQAEGMLPDAVSEAMDDASSLD